MDIIPLGHPSTWENISPAPYHDFDGMVTFLKGVQADNDDAIVLLDGLEGGGKSTVAFELARNLKPDWNPEEHLIIDFDDWEEVYALEEGQVFVLDEGGDLLFSRDFNSRESKLIVRMLQMARIYNHILIICCPNIHWVDLYIRAHRALIYGHIVKGYHPKGVTRGLVEWKWPRRWWNWEQSEWVTQWLDSHESRFRKVSDHDGSWTRYEVFKKMKVQKRQMDLQQSLSKRRS